MEVEVPHSAFAVRSGGEAAGFSVVFGWSWAVIVWKIYVFLDCPFPDSLTRILCCDFFVCAHYHFCLPAGSSSVQSGIYESKGKTLGIHCRIIPQVLRSLTAAPSLHLSVFLRLFNNIQGF